MQISTDTFYIRDSGCLSMVYESSVAQPCLEIQKDINTAYGYSK